MAKNIDEQEELETEGDHAETRVYELGFHLDADLPTEEVKKTFQALRGVISDAGTVVAEGEPQKIPLAYTISRSEHAGRRDFDTAFFCWIAYETDGAGHDKVTEAAKAESRIIRFLDIRTTNDAAKHSAEMEEIYAKMPEKVEEDETADVELDAALKEVGVAP